ncbi:natural cytotoxicity triggering receptor 3 ligand 1-like [Heterocephalus glaber]|uniref:Natural cytotoxicity triggering receptor 3 ligand 1-like n=1 Tax=Heterocephalus glaber TaxID=10181 RepID=A0AAX6TCC8_HETGA|nr:natural cytotoxicity triggering receptor 3 ligand 1-like [Heterocephalus glaber]
MPGRPQIAPLNGNVTISCKVPGCPRLDTRIMGVTWYRKDPVSEAEVKVFELYGDWQKAFRPGALVSPQRLKRGDASLQLPGVGLGDAGEYRCELTVTPQKAEGRVLLKVLGECLRAVPCSCHGAGPGVGMQLGHVGQRVSVWV